MISTLLVRRSVLSVELVGAIEFLIGPRIDFFAFSRLNIFPNIIWMVLMRAWVWFVSDNEKVTAFYMRTLCAHYYYFWKHPFLLASNTDTYELQTISAFYRWAVRGTEDASDVDVSGQALVNECHHVQLDQIRRQILVINDTPKWNLKGGQFCFTNSWLVR